MDQVSRQAFVADDAPAPSAGYSQVVKVGNVVWAAGQAGLDPRTREYVAADIEGQTQQALKNLEAVLAAAGARLDQVVRVGVFLASLEDRRRMNAVYDSFFGNPPPARTTVGAVLPDGMRIELDAMAVVE